MYEVYVYNFVCTFSPFHVINFLVFYTSISLSSCDVGLLSPEAKNKESRILSSYRISHCPFRLCSTFILSLCHSCVLAQRFLLLFVLLLTLFSFCLSYLNGELERNLINRKRSLYFPEKKIVSLNYKFNYHGESRWVLVETFLYACVLSLFVVLILFSIGWNIHSNIGLLFYASNP